MSTTHADLSVNSLTSDAAPPVTEQERYLFDLQGYLAIPDVLDAPLLAELNRLMDDHVAEEVEADATQHRFAGRSLLGWGRAYLRLLDHPRLVPYLQAFIDDQYRLDHDYADIIRSGHSPIGASLHGGNTPYDASCYYHHRDGRIRSGLVAVAFNLRDVAPGDGGFACIPGSHHAQFPLPASWISLDHPASCVRSVPGPAGSVVLFTEALTHGTLPWRGRSERRTVFFKYSPVCMSWSATYYQPQDFPDLSPSQRALLEAPNARYAGRSGRA